MTVPPFVRFGGCLLRRQEGSSGPVRTYLCSLLCHVGGPRLALTERGGRGGGAVRALWLGLRVLWVFVLPAPGVRACLSVRLARLMNDDCGVLEHAPPAVCVRARRLQLARDDVRRLVPTLRPSALAACAPIDCSRGQWMAHVLLRLAMLLVHAVRVVLLFISGSCEWSVRRKSLAPCPWQQGAGAYACVCARARACVHACLWWLVVGVFACGLRCKSSKTQASSCCCPA